MRSLRQFAEFVNNPHSPISPRVLANYLRFHPNTSALSLREMIEAMEATPSAFWFINIQAQPEQAIVPFQATLLIRGVTGYVLDARLQIYREDETPVEYYLPGTNGTIPSVTHMFTEPGIYLVDARVRGIGVNGYRELMKRTRVRAVP